MIAIKKYILFLIINFTALLFVWKNLFTTDNTAVLLSYRFTFVCPQIWEQVGEGMRSADQNLGTSTRCIGLRNADEKQQAAAIRKAIYSRVTGIITAGNIADEEVAGAIHMAQEEGIPVLLIDSDIPVSGRCGYVGPDNEAVGTQAGKELKKNMESGANIAVILSSLENQNQEERLKSFEKEIENQQDMEIVCMIEDGGDSLQVRAKLLKAFQENPQIIAIYCATETSSEVVGDALKNIGRQPGEVVVISFGMTEKIYRFLTDGWYQKSIMPDRFSEGLEAVRSLKSYVSRSKDFQEHIYIDTEAVGKEFDYEGWLEKGSGMEVTWDLS